MLWPFVWRGWFGGVGESSQRENLRCCVLNEGNIALFTNPSRPGGIKEDHLTTGTSLSPYDWNMLPQMISLSIRSLRNVFSHTYISLCRQKSGRRQVRIDWCSQNTGSYLPALSSLICWLIASWLQDGCCNSRWHVCIQGTKKWERVVKTPAVFVIYLGKAKSFPRRCLPGPAARTRSLPWLPSLAEGNLDTKFRFPMLWNGGSKGRADWKCLLG